MGSSPCSPGRSVRQWAVWESEQEITAMSFYLPLVGAPNIWAGGHFTDISILLWHRKLKIPVLDPRNDRAQEMSGASRKRVTVILTTGESSCKAVEIWLSDLPSMANMWHDCLYSSSMYPWQGEALSLISCPQMRYTVLGESKFPDSGEVQAEVRVCGGRAFRHQEDVCTRLSPIVVNFMSKNDFIGGSLFCFIGWKAFSYKWYDLIFTKKRFVLFPFYRWANRPQESSHIWLH